MLKAKYWRSGWADKVDAQVLATTEVAEVALQAEPMPVVEAAVHRTSELVGLLWLTGSRWLLEAAAWAEGIPMRKLEMAGAIRGAMETVPSDKAVAEPLRIQAVVAARLGLDQETTVALVV